MLKNQKVFVDFACSGLRAKTKIWRKNWSKNEVEYKLRFLIDFRSIFATFLEPKSFQKRSHSNVEEFQIEWYFYNKKWRRNPKIWRPRTVGRHYGAGLLKKVHSAHPLHANPFSQSTSSKQGHSETKTSRVPTRLGRQRAQSGSKRLTPFRRPLKRSALARTQVREMGTTEVWR